jgi:hypothetical protein
VSISLTFTQLARFCPHTVTGSTRRSIPVTRIYKTTTKPLPNLNIDSDNEARAAFRGGDDSLREVRLPPGFDPFEKAFDSHQLEIIEKETGTFTLARQGKNDRAITIKIWGEAAACAIAQQRLSQWAQAQHRTNNQRWSKIGVYKGWDKEQTHQKRLEREEKRQRYRQKANGPLISVKRFAFCIVLKFNETDWKLEDILGPQMEALDPIRMVLTYPAESSAHLITHLTGSPMLYYLSTPA